MVNSHFNYRFKASSLLYLFLFSILMANGEDHVNNPVQWHELQKGLFFREIDAPEKSFVGDSRIFILKADPGKCKFLVLSASEHKKKNRSADEWAHEFGMKVVVNAGMFNMANKRTNKGYLKNYSHFNNSHLNGSYNVMMGMNPKRDSDTSMIICDMTCRDWESIQANYHTLCQGMRMIDFSGNPLAWDKRPGQACSMVIGATDTAGNIYFVFSRSPYAHQKMIGFMMALIPGIRTTVYLEGGPEASLYIQTGDTTITKIGSYVSKTYPNDNNDHFWKIPNVIGINPK